MLFRTHSFLCIFVFMYLLSSSAFSADVKLDGVRIWPSPDSTRVVLDFNQAPTFSYFMLSQPDRLVIDLTNTKNLTKLNKVEAKGDITKIRSSKTAKKNIYRLVLELKSAVKPVLFPLAPAGPYGHRLVVDLPKKRVQTINVEQVKKSKRDIIIAVDAGHGGEDPGAIGPSNVYEKKVTLAIAKRLAKQINAQKGLKAVLIRTGDYYLNLNKRSRIARDSHADLLVSIHADGFSSSEPSGASVWVLSNRRANTEIGRWLERHEEQSELLGGVGGVISGMDAEHYLSMTLLDLTMENSRGTGFEVASKVLGELKKVTKLHKKEPNHASLAVLKSPDIPSLLVETGFISNKREEKLLQESGYQEKLAAAMFKGIKQYFANRPPDGTYFASIKKRRHVVKSGESLSVLAQRYKISMTNLKKANKLKSNSLRIGQILMIPST